MLRRPIPFTFTFFIIILGGCFHDITYNPCNNLEVEGNLAISVCTDNLSDERTTSDGMTIKLTATDPIMIFGIGSDSRPKASCYAIHESGTATTLDWSEEIIGTEGPFTVEEIPQYALYHTSDIINDISVAGSTITFKVSDTQTYSNTISTGANVSVGKVSSLNGLTSFRLKNAFGYLKLQVSVPSGDAAKVGKIILTAKGGEKLWGTFTTDASSNTPSAIYKPGAMDGNSFITMDCLEGVKISDDPSSPTSFTFVVPAGHFLSGFTAEIYSKQNHLMTTIETPKAITVGRNKVKTISNTTFDWIPASISEQVYIQSDSHQCIDTEYGNADGFRFLIDFDLMSFCTTDEHFICGVVNSGEPLAYSALDNTQNRNEFIFRYLVNSYHDGYLDCSLRKYLIDASFTRNNQYLLIDGNKIVSYSDDISILDFSACICGAHRIESDGKLTYKAGPSAKWYYSEMYDADNVLIRKFIPAYSSTGEKGHQYGFYDVLNDKFYSNVYSGTGARDFSGMTIYDGEKDPLLTFNSYCIDVGEVLGTADGLISICVPPGTDLTDRVASFSTDADKVLVGDVDQHSGVTSNNFSNEVTYTLWKGKQYNTVKVLIYDFQLPVVWIETPGHLPISSKKDWTEKATAKLFSSGRMSSLGTTQIKGRGNSTWWTYQKKPYTLKLDKESAILEMPKDKRWDLIANWMDRTDMRNDIALQLARVSPGLDWTPKGRHVELIMNGIHQGNYYLCEHIKIAKDRVNISAIDEDDPVDLTGGYLMEFDINSDEVNRFFTSLRLHVMLKDPDWTTGFNIRYIRNWINNLEMKLTDPDISSTDYSDFIDIDSFIDWWFVHEMTGNWEPNHPKSSYMYKDKESAPDNKIHAGPCWDFDWGTFIPNRAWIIKSALWYSYLFNDPSFVARTKEKWNTQKEVYYVISTKYIDTLSAQIEKSVAMDKIIWPCSSEINGDNDLSFKDAVERIRSSLQGKIDWMDTEINKW